MPLVLLIGLFRADVNEAPLFTSSLTATVPENAAVGTFVYGMRVAREDCNDAYSFTINAQEGGMFAVEAPRPFAVRSGSLLVSIPANFEVQSSYVVTIGVTDDSLIAPGGKSRMSDMRWDMGWDGWGGGWSAWRCNTTPAAVTQVSRLGPRGAGALQACCCRGPNVL